MDTDHKVILLDRYESLRKPVHIDFAIVVEPQLWKRHQENWQDVLDLLGKSQLVAKQIRKIIEEATRRSS